VTLPVRVPLSSHSCVRGNSPLTTMLGVWSFGQNLRSWTLLLLSTRYANLLVCMYIYRQGYLSSQVIYSLYLGNTLKLCVQGPKDKTYETKEWEFAVIDVSGNTYTVYTVRPCTQYVYVHHRSSLVTLWKACLGCEGICLLCILLYMYMYHMCTCSHDQVYKN
jgi:hypothetical protein